MNPTSVTLLRETASQTAGPYVHIGLAPQAAGFDIFDNNFGNVLVTPQTKGERIRIEGIVTDGSGTPLRDVLIEIWQANAEGKYAHTEDPQDKPLAPGFRGFGRVPTDGAGRFRFSTIKPGAVPDLRGHLQAPHLLISVFMRGLLKRLVTRMYFPSDERNADDGVLRLVSRERQGTLIATQKEGERLEWNIVLQGTDETVFFDC